MKDEDVKKIEEITALDDYDFSENENSLPNIKRMGDDRIKKLFILAGVVRTKNAPSVNELRKTLSMNYYTCKKWHELLNRMPEYTPFSDEKQRAVVEQLVKQAKIMIGIYESATVEEEAYDEPLPDDPIKNVDTFKKEPLLSEGVVDVARLAFDYEKELSNEDLKLFREFKKDDEDEYEEIDFATRYQKK